VLGVGACTDTDPAGTEAPETQVAAEGDGGGGDHDKRTIGDVLPGTDLALFSAAREAFAALEDIDEGLGPLFNERGCGACHTTPVVGGSGPQIERRFGRMDGSTFFGYDAEPNNQGGTLRQLFTVGTFDTDEQTCTVPGEVVPSDATASEVGRRTTPLFGLGLVDAMPDRFFDRLAARQPSSVRGIAQRVAVVLPDPRDKTQSIGSTRVGRFGWKGQVPSLLVFSGDAYNNEMGITTQSCFKGQTILDFATENFPNNIPPAPGCRGGDLAPLQTAHEDVPEFTDDVVGPCGRSRTEIQDDLLLFTFFMESLAPPPRDLSAGRLVRRGGRVFEEIGCADCHVTDVFVTPRRPFNGVPGGYRFQPFSDFLAHDMGTLGDGIANTGDDVAQTRMMRTAPLWGARFNTSFLHDGSALTVEDAILAHDGQALRSLRGFGRLSDREQAALLAYVLSL